MTDKDVCDAIEGQYPTPCHKHPHGVAVEEDRWGAFVYCGPCLDAEGLDARLGIGQTVSEAVRDWNALLQLLASASAVLAVLL